MRKITVCMLTAIFALAIAGATAVCAEEDGKWYSGELKVGATVVPEKLSGDESGAKGGTEYNSLFNKRWTTYLGGNLDAMKDGFAFSFDGLYRDVDEQDYSGLVSLKRVINFKTDYSRFYHRLDHDYMENLNAHVFPPASTGWKNWGSSPDLADIPGGKTVGSANVYNTDLDPDNFYGIARAEWKNKVDFNIPMLPGLKLSFNHRFEERKGDKQVMTNSKCLACHVVSNTQNIHETTNDYAPKASLRIGTLAMEFSYLHREFETSNEDMSLVYNGLKGKELFLNRLQYDNTTGELPYSRTPDSSKDSFKGKFRWDINAHNTFTANYIYSQSTNNSVDGAYDILMGKYGDEINLDSNIFNAKFHSRINRAFSFNLFGRYQDLDNDAVDIEKNVRTNPAGAPGGAVTLSEGYINNSGSSYFEEEESRPSGYDGNAYIIGTDLTWRVMRGLKVKFGYEFEREKRDNYEHHHVPESTKEHKFNLATDWRINHNLKFDFDYKFEYIDDPYVLKDAECTPDGAYGVYSGLPAGLYDVDRAYAPAIYDERTAARSNLPDQVHEIQLKSHWHPLHILSTNFHVKYRYAKNGDVDGRDWKQNMVMAGLGGILTPMRNLVLSAGYTYMYDKYDSQYCIALYDG